MNFLEKVANTNWAPNDTTKLEAEIIARTSFMPDSPPTENIDTLLELITSKPKKLDLDIPKPVHKYIPGKVFFPKDVTSTLTRKQQAICLKARQLALAGANAQQKHADVLEVAQSLQSTIKEENEKFLNYVEQDWKKGIKRKLSVRPKLVTYAQSRWTRKLHKLKMHYPQLYKQLSTISLANQPPVSVARSSEVTQMGVVADFSPPSLLLKYIPPIFTLPEEAPMTFNSKSAVSMDENIDNFIDNHQFDVVISSSALKRLMDNSDYSCEWDIPIVVKQHKKQQDGKCCNIIYIDKPLPKRTPSTKDFNEYCYRHLMRTNFCLSPKVIYPHSEDPQKNPFYSESTEKTAPSTPLNHRTTYHNVSYDIWTLKIDSDQQHLMKTRVMTQEIRVLIRYKLDACETLSNGDMRPVVVVPKLEYQIEHGANIATKSELIRQWTALFFRPFSTLYRVRMIANTSEVVSVENVTLQKINSEAFSHYNDHPHLRLGALYTIFSELIKLAPGSYLLHHSQKHGAFADILRAEGKSPQGKSYNLHETYDIKNCKVAPAVKKWCPIDVNYILPVHETYKRLPGMFKPLIRDIQRKGKGFTTKVTKAKYKNKKAKKAKKKKMQTK